MFDAELYREKAEVEKWKMKDPIKLFINLLKENEMISEDKLENLEKEVEMELNEAVEFAENGKWEPVEELARFVYSEVEEQ